MNLELETSKLTRPAAEPRPQLESRGHGESVICAVTAVSASVSGLCVSLPATECVTGSTRAVQFRVQRGALSLGIPVEFLPVQQIQGYVKALQFERVTVLEDFYGSRYKFGFEMRVVSYDTAVDTAVRHATIVSVLSYDSFSDPPSLPPPYPARDPLPLVCNVIVIAGHS